jgi:hypothetical protein
VILVVVIEGAVVFVEKVTVESILTVDEFEGVEAVVPLAVKV